MGWDRYVGTPRGTQFDKKKVMISLHLFYTCYIKLKRVFLLLVNFKIINIF